MKSEVTYFDGANIVKGEVFYRSNGTKSGCAEYHKSNGKQKAYTAYHYDGITKSEVRKYWENGVCKWMAEYASDGMPVLKKTYYENGYISSVKHYFRNDGGD